LVILSALALLSVQEDFVPFRLGPYLAETTVGMGVLGAIISGTNAMARNSERVRKGLLTPADAAVDVGKEALKNGVVTAATFVAVASLGGELVASVGLTLVIGTTLKYAWDRGYDALDEERAVAKRKRLPKPQPSPRSLARARAPASA
jgi:hypothetical protein